MFFSTAISVYSGVDAVPRNLIRMAQSFNVPFHAIVRRVIWPGALPSILAGFRITASIALLLVVSAEMIGAEYGIGAFVLQAGNLMQTDQLLAGVVILSLFGLAVGQADQLAGDAAVALAVSRSLVVPALSGDPYRVIHRSGDVADAFVESERLWLSGPGFRTGRLRSLRRALTHCRDLRGTDRASAAPGGPRN